jgi:hypothetical protein
MSILLKKIKEKAKFCELGTVKNPADYFCMVCVIAGHDSADTRKKFMLAKVVTFAKAGEICQEKEKSCQNSLCLDQLMLT